MSTTPAGTPPAAPAPEVPPTTPAPVPTAPEPTPPPAPAEPPPAATADEPLGEAGKAALAAERKRADDAVKDAAAQRKRADELESEKLTDQQKLEKRAEDGDAALVKATAKIQRANLITALADKGLMGGKARAAARLLEVEFDDSDEPKDLDDAIKAATAEYGEELFKGAMPEGSGDQPTGETPEGQTPTPNLHQGPQTPMTDEQEEQAIAALTGSGMFGASPAGKSPISIAED